VSAVGVGTIVLVSAWRAGAVWQYTNWAAANDHSLTRKNFYTWLGERHPGISPFKSPKEDSRRRLQAEAGFLLDPIVDCCCSSPGGRDADSIIYSTG